jgi:mRNA interferase MazF
MKQGDIYRYAFSPPDKRRPVLILTRNSVMPHLTSITVAAITSNIRGVPSEVLLTPEEDGVLTDCAINAYNIYTVQKARLDSFLTTLSLDRMREVRKAIEFALGFDAMR